MRRDAPSSQQTGFLEVFDQQARERATAHLPSDIDQGVITYRGVLAQFDRAMHTGDLAGAAQVYAEAYRLAEKLNGGTRFGVIAGEQAPGCVLARETKAPAGEIPQWGQEGEFVVTVYGVRIRITMGGLFGVGELLPSFAAHVVDEALPFISETGYRSFAGLRTPPEPGMTTAEWVCAILDAYITQTLRSRLVPIAPRYRTASTPSPEVG